jgi:hypothetical protein
MPTDPETGLPEVLSQMIYEQGKVIIDAAIDEAVAAERERYRPLVAQWRKSADSLASSNPAWSSHFYDCALELDRLRGEQ